jgi:HSP20 family protein
MLEEAFSLPSLRRVSPKGRQVIPINMYETDEDLMIVAPMPGVHPDDIEITVRGGTLTIQSRMRGSLEETKDYLRHEWHYGPYVRVITLPFDVDANKANARFGNGVLTLALPKAESTRAKRIRLHRLGPTEGEYAHHGAAEFSPQAYEELEKKEHPAKKEEPEVRQRKQA